MHVGTHVRVNHEIFRIILWPYFLQSSSTYLYGWSLPTPPKQLKRTLPGSKALFKTHDQVGAPKHMLKRPTSASAVRRPSAVQDADEAVRDGAATCGTAVAVVEEVLLLLLLLLLLLQMETLTLHGLHGHPT